MALQDASIIFIFFFRRICSRHYTDARYVLFYTAPAARRRKPVGGIIAGAICDGCVRVFCCASGATDTKRLRRHKRTRKALDFFTLDAAENVMLERLGSAEENVLRICHCSTR